MSHIIQLKVRDYECDMQGIVNNSVYGNYFEHARHEFLHTKGISFAQLCDQKIYLVVSKLEIEYLKSLKSGDNFVVQTQISFDGRLKICFHQTIAGVDDASPNRLPKEIHPPIDRKLARATALVTGVALNEQGKPLASAVLRSRLTSN